MDRQEAAFVVMSVEQRQLLMAMHDIGGVVEIEGDRLRWAGVTLAPQVHHAARHPDQRAQVGRILPSRHRRLRVQVIAALRQPSAGQLECRVAAQIVEVVGIGVAAGDGEDTATQNVGHCVGDQGLVAVVGNDRGQHVDQAKPLVGIGEQYHAAVGTDQPTIESSGDFLLADTWQ